METKKASLKSYSVKWYGPFHSISDVEDWEQEENISYHLYLLQGKRRNAKNYSYYCGRTGRSCSRRFKDKYHHINEIPQQQNIWVGRFTNRFNGEDIKVAENLLIHTLARKVNETQLINKVSLDFQSMEKNICMVIQWSNPRLNKQPENSIKTMFPDVIVYDSDNDEIKVSKKLHLL